MKFSIRDLFLVTLIVALGVGWSVDKRQSRAQRIDEREQERWETRAWEGRAWATRAMLEREGWKVNWKRIGEFQGDTYAPPSPNASAPAPNPPKK